VTLEQYGRLGKGESDVLSLRHIQRLTRTEMQVNTGEIGSESIMAASDYTRGEMNVDAQKSMYEGTMKAGAWGAIITLLILGYSTFILSMGMPWLVALVICAGAGIVIGLGMGFGGAWVATIVALSMLALFVQLLVTLFSLVF
jgi:hypothetical protein